MPTSCAFVRCAILAELNFRSDDSDIHFENAIYQIPSNELETQILINNFIDKKNPHPHALDRPGAGASDATAAR